jgi:hypothetical protein
MTMESTFATDGRAGDDVWREMKNSLTELLKRAAALGLDADDAELEAYLEEREALEYAFCDTPATTPFARHVIVAAAKLGFGDTDTLERACA